MSTIHDPLRNAHFWGFSWNVSDTVWMGFLPHLKFMRKGSSGCVSTSQLPRSHVLTRSVFEKRLMISRKNLFSKHLARVLILFWCTSVLVPAFAPTWWCCWWWCWWYHDDSPEHVANGSCHQLVTVAKDLPIDFIRAPDTDMVLGLLQFAWLHFVPGCCVKCHVWAIKVLWLLMNSSKDFKRWKDCQPQNHNCVALWSIWISIIVYQSIYLSIFLSFFLSLFLPLNRFMFLLYISYLSLCSFYVDWTNDIFVECIYLCWINYLIICRHFYRYSYIRYYVHWPV